MCWAASRAWALPISTDVSQEIADGQRAYEDKRWAEAMRHFIEVLTKDPANREAHQYIDLLAQSFHARQEHATHDQRLAILSGASRLLGNNSRIGLDSRPVDRALQETTSAEAQHQKDDWHARCGMALIEAQLGHLPAANDIVLQIISENPSFAEAQRLLSDLQSQIHNSLETRTDLPVAERQALQGFYAFGQADYATAAAAWGQARKALEDHYSSQEAIKQESLLHFAAYEKMAQAHLEEEERVAKTRGLFTDGLGAFNNHDYDKALDNFRQVALLDPNFAELGSYLVQSEAALERQRTSDLSESKRQQAAQAFTRGVSNLANGKNDDAKSAFKEVLAIEPKHPKAKLYLEQIETQKPKTTNPDAAQQHYESGVIAYVSGDLEEAIREWNVALRFDPENPKVLTAVNKVQRELALSKELP